MYLAALKYFCLTTACYQLRKCLKSLIEVSLSLPHDKKIHTVYQYKNSMRKLYDIFMAFYLDKIHQNNPWYIFVWVI